MNFVGVLLLLIAGLFHTIGDGFEFLGDKARLRSVRGHLKRYAAGRR